jgi:hypothetical protein
MSVTVRGPIAELMLRDDDCTNTFIIGYTCETCVRVVHMVHIVNIIVSFLFFLNFDIHHVIEKV